MRDDGRTCKRLIDAIRVVHIVTLKHKVLIGRNGRQTRHQICKPNPCCAHLQYEMTLRQRDSQHDVAMERISDNDTWNVFSQWRTCVACTFCLQTIRRQKLITTSVTSDASTLTRSSPSTLTPSSPSALAYWHLSKADPQDSTAQAP